MRTIHFRPLPAEPTECEILAAWVEQTETDRAAIREYQEECRAVKAKEAIARVKAATDTVSERGGFRMAA